MHHVLKRENFLIHELLMIETQTCKHRKGRKRDASHKLPPCMFEKDLFGERQFSIFLLTSHWKSCRLLTPQAPTKR